MWIKSSAELTESVYQITTATSSHILAWGRDAGIVDSGISATHGRLADEITRYIGGAHNLKYIFLTHADFDHIGGIPHLREFAPHIELVTSPQCVAALSDKSHIEQAYEKNLACAQAMEVELGIKKQDWCDAFTVDQVLGDGDSIDLGDGLKVKLINCPGHREESCAFYITPDAVLQAGEAVGAYYGREKVVPCFTYDFENYLRSLDRMCALDLRFLALAHNGALTGDLAKNFLRDQRTASERMLSSIKERISLGETLDEIGASILQEWKQENICPEGPFVAEQEATLRGMLKAISEE